MNLKALITTLIIGSSSIVASSVAMASPSVAVDARASWGTPAAVVRDHRIEAPTPAPIVRDHRDDDQIKYVQPGYANTWQTHQDDCVLQPLTGAINLKVNKLQTFRVNARLKALELAQIKGSTRINTVTIVYANGRRDTLNIGERMWASNPTIKVPLNARQGAVSYLQLDGVSNAPASFRILGQV